MMRNVSGLLAGFGFALILFGSCNKNSSVSSGIWQEEDSTFLIEEEEVGYTLPTDVTLWAVAGHESLPPAMDFFAIDKAEEVCVGIFRPDAPLSGAGFSRSYSRGEVNNMVREISSPRMGQKVVEEKSESRLMPDSTDRSWYFSLARKIVDPSLPADTFAINYSGYLFDGKTRPFGLIVISSVNPSDSIGGRIFEKYVSGLKIGK